MNFKVSSIQPRKNDSLCFFCLFNLSDIEFKKMSEGEVQSSKIKTKEQYSRNVKKLKVKLMNVRNEIETIERKVQNLTNTSNDKMIALKIAKFCKERRFTPEMLFRFADRTGDNSVSKIEFQGTLTRLGLKLNKEEIMRLEYLIDEDLSGYISKQEYNAYLDAFGIKKQFTPGETTAREVLQKLDLDKLLRADSDDSEGRSKMKKKRDNLLTYEDFVKYCHKHYKELKDKEIATIFERLQRNQLINLQHFLDYLQDQREQIKKLQEKNKRRKLKKGESLLTDKSAINESHSLKGLIQALFRTRSNKSGPIFHSAEFLRLEKLLNRKRGELTSIFKAIDKKRKNTGLGDPFRGSFGYNELINFYIDHQEKSNDLVFAFELMGHKIAAFNHSPDSIVSQYMQSSEKMAENEFKKLMEAEFEVIDREYQIISKCLPRQQGMISKSKIIELMKAQSSKDKVFIRPGIGIVSTRMVFRSGLMALRCCLDLEDKLIKAKQTQWDDYEFGPTQSDEFGNDSIDLPMPSEQIVWERAQKMGMLEFYKQGSAHQADAVASACCPHDLLSQSLVGLARGVDNWLYPSTEPSSSVREVTIKELNHLFNGIYPYIFHPFAKYGIYVIKVWNQQHWRYVVIDDKLPCGLDGKPYFSCSLNFRYSFISLIEKAVAKIYGNYKTAFEVNNTQRYLMEMTGALCLEEPLSESMPEETKNSIWRDILSAFTVSKQNENQAKKSQVKDIMLGLFKGAKQGIDTNFPLRLPLKVNYALQISNSSKQNKHKSHRLLVLSPGVELKDEKEWNKGWSKQVAENKYDKVCDKNLYPDPANIFINYKLFRKGFNLIKLRKIDWQLNIVLRKDLQFEEKYRCRYEITAKSTDLQLVVYLKQQMNLNDARVALDIKRILNGKQTSTDQKTLKSILSLFALKFEKDQSIILEFYIENWKPEEKYLYGLTFYFSHPRYELKQRDRHMLFRYVSPFEEQSKIEWDDFTKQQKQFVYRTFYKAAEPRGCCGCL